MDRPLSSVGEGLRPAKCPAQSLNPVPDPEGLQNFTGLRLTFNLAVEAAFVGNRGVWEEANALNNLNALTPQRIASFGLNVTNAADNTLLNSRLDSALAQSRGFKAPYAGFPLSATVAQSLRLFPQFSTIPVYWSPLGNSWYDGLQTKVTKRSSHGLVLSAAFSWQDFAPSRTPQRH